MDDQEEKTPAERALILLETLGSHLPSPESILKGEPLPQWLLQPWASRLGDLDDPNLEEAVTKAEEWLNNL